MKTNNSSISEKEFDTIIPKIHILKPDENLKNAITGEELLSRLIPHIEKGFENQRKNSDAH